MKTHHLIFGYRGNLTNELITSILQLADSKLKELKAPFKKKKAIINILIECLQNILYHSEASQDTDFQGHQCIFLLGKTDEKFFIQIGNYIHNKVKPELKSKLDYMNTLQNDEIHNLYLEVLDKGQISEKGGAGLGILRILKDSGEQVSYEFFPVDDSNSFFCMEINVLT